jgi:hypothetical protein
MHSIKYTYAPPSFSNIWAKSNARDLDYNLRNAELYSVPNIRFELFRKIPFISLPTAWNEIGEEL